MHKTWNGRKDIRVLTANLRMKYLKYIKPNDKIKNVNKCVGNIPYRKI